MDPYHAFSHGLVVSKIWLCEHLEKIMDTEQIQMPIVKILGGWNNLISFMMLVRRPEGYHSFYSYDLDEKNTNAANGICNTWQIQKPFVNNQTIDVLSMDFSDSIENTIFINCSVDQFISTSWYDTIPKNSLVCMQTTDIVDDAPAWEILQKTKDLTELKTKYHMSKILFEGVKNISYPTLSYNRLMLIGFK